MGGLLPAPGDVLAQKLRVIRKLGEGGMGAVYEVEHTITHHRRALKLLHAQFAQNAGVLARFLREASAAGRIGNEHIAETFDAGTLESGEPYLVMELLRGEPLTDLLARKGKLSPEEMAELIGQACEGIAAAHEAGIIHRDIKPDNLYVTERDGRPFVKVLDFGISKFDASLVGENAQPLTREGAMLGTPYYMSPEQFRGESGVDGQADVYSLGVVLYECATGHRPFDGATLPELVLKIAEGKPEPLGALRPDLPEALTTLIHQSFAADRGQRPPSVKALRSRLLAAVAGGLGATVAAETAREAAALTGHAEPLGGAAKGTSSRAWWALIPLVAVVAALAFAGVRRDPEPVPVSKNSTDIEPSAPVIAFAYSVLAQVSASASPPSSGAPSSSSPPTLSAPSASPRSSAGPARTAPDATSGKPTRAQQTGLGQNPY